jgi:hypothetical protein
VPREKRTLLAKKKLYRVLLQTKKGRPRGIGGGPSLGRKRPKRAVTACQQRVDDELASNWLLSISDIVRYRAT